MKIAIAQLDIVWENKEENFKKVEKLAQDAKGCDVLVLPETFSTGFSMKTSLSEPKGGKTEQFISQLASSLNINIIAGYLVKHYNKAKNISAVFSRKGRLLATYVKIHPFSLLEEDKYFVPGKSPVIFKIDGTPCSVFICYDLRFPEVFRKIAHNVFVIFIIANWPSSRDLHWQCLLKARAIENQCFIVGVNRVGVDGNGIAYSGHSSVYDPWGNEILIADNKESINICHLQIEKILEIREKYPFLKDRKTDNDF